MTHKTLQWSQCPRCNAPHNWGGYATLCRACMVKDGQAFREAKARGEISGVIIVAQWRA